MKQIVILWTCSVIVVLAWLRTQNWGKWVCQSYKKIGPNIALLNKPFASGESISEATAMEPPDWPKIVTKVVYMSSSFLQLAIGSRNLYQAEKDITVCKAEQLPIMMTTYVLISGATGAARAPKPGKAPIMAAAAVAAFYFSKSR